MAQERFIRAEVLPVEVVDRIQRKLRGVYIAVQDDPHQVGTVTVRFTVRANDLKDVDGEYTIESKLSDRIASETGKIRDGQLVLPGTEVRSDEAPADWQSALLGHPGNLVKSA